jgi:hypothetical protein
LKGKIKPEAKYKGVSPGNLSIKVSYDCGCLNLTLGAAQVKEHQYFSANKPLHRCLASPAKTLMGSFTFYPVRQGSVSSRWEITRHTRTFHFIYIDSCTDIVYYYTVYTSCIEGLYLFVHNCTLLYDLTLPKHTLVVHTLCSDQLYCSTFIRKSILCALWASTTVYTTALYNCTHASASLASVLSTNHRRASIYLLCSDWSIRHHLLAPILIAAC